MEAHGIDPLILASLREVRDQLLFDLTDQTAPPAPYSEPLWQAFKLLEQGIEAMTKAGGIGACWELARQNLTSAFHPLRTLPHIFMLLA